MQIADLHIHSNCSDGSVTPQELPNIIKQANIDIFALTDHDTVDGCIELRKSYNNFINGIELTCKFNEIKSHILGLDIDINNKDLQTLLQKGRKLRRIKLETRIKYLKEIHNIELNEQELEWLYSRHSVVKTHLANILVKRGLASCNIEAMKKYLDDCKTGNTRFDGCECIDIIKKSNGIAIWAHPLGGEGEIHLTPEEFKPKFDKMLNYGIQGLECYYSRYNEQEIKFLVECAKSNNLYISGGSDFHGSNKDIPAGRLNTENRTVSADKLTVLEKITWKN